MPGVFKPEVWEPKAVLERFWGKVDESTGPDGCWAWTGSVDKHGYPVFGYARGKRMAANRFIWQHVNAVSLRRCDILRKSCGNSSCCNLNHTILYDPQIAPPEMKLGGPLKLNAEIGFWDRVDKKSSPTGCWLWTGAHLINPRSKQASYGFWCDNARKRVLAHRFSYERLVGPIPNDLDLCHTCDNPQCVNPEHLFPGTRQANVDDCLTKKRHAHGEKSPQHILTEYEVQNVKILYATGKYFQRELAENYGVHIVTINDVLKGRTWKHLL